MKWSGIGYRAHDPAWAWQPLSGAGAAAKGGRFNPVGRPALYLALSVEGMFLEMNHGFGHRFDPLTVCSYNIDVDDLVDLRTAKARDTVGVSYAEMACSWALNAASGDRPASSDVAERLIGGGAAGVLVPSFARGARHDMQSCLMALGSEAYSSGDGPRSFQPSRQAAAEMNSSRHTHRSRE